MYRYVWKGLKTMAILAFIPILIYIAIFATLAYLIVSFINFMKTKTENDRALLEAMHQLIKRVESLEAAKVKEEKVN